MDKARVVAAQVVYEVHAHGAYSNVALTKALRAARLNNLDRRFATELVYGTIKLGASIDWIISKYITRPLDKVEPKILAILRVGMYQIFFLDRIPNFAAINESVEIAKKVGFSASKFVNAVLRSAVREPEKATFPTGDSAEDIAIYMYHPKWLIEDWIGQFGVDLTKKICTIDNTEPPVTLRINTLKTTRQEFLEILKTDKISYTLSEKAEEAVLIKSIGREIGSLDNFQPLKDGLCQVQDASSMLVAHALKPQPGEFIIDCCAAPGGKTTHIAQLMDNRGKILAVDTHAHKIKLIEANAARLGIDIIETILTDARKLHENYSGVADRVLVDAPCSGLGVLRHKADLRWNKTPEQISALPTLQLEILQSAALTLKVGGTLVYSTCTLNPAENDSVIDKFLRSHSDFGLNSKELILPDLDCDGFFIASFCRNR